MRMTIRSAAQRRVVSSLAALGHALDAVPSVGRTVHVREPTTAPGEADDDMVDDLVIEVGGFTVYRRGGWASRYTLLPVLVTELDHRWGTDLLGNLAEPPRLHAVR